jgi:ParB family chromosome partitioning protein
MAKIVNQVGFNEEKKQLILKIDPKLVLIDNTKNPRAEENYNVEELELSIKENGQKDPIVVTRFFDETDGIDKYILLHGFRRMRAINNLIAKGEDIKYTEAKLIDKPLDEEVLLLHYTLNNTGKALTMLEEAEIFAKLINNYAWDKKQVATRIGKNVSYINNLLILVNLPQTVKNDIKLGIISPSAVIATYFLSDENINKTVNEINTSKEKAYNEGKEKVTARHIEVIQKKKTEKFEKKAREKGFIKTEQEIENTPVIEDNTHAVSNILKESIVEFLSQINNKELKIGDLLLALKEDVLISEFIKKINSDTP